MKIFPLTIYVLLKPFIQILPSDSKKSLWDSHTTAILAAVIYPYYVTIGKRECSSKTFFLTLFWENLKNLKKSFFDLEVLFFSP
jgi:hypothetical protein